MIAPVKADIITQLRNDIFRMQGFKRLRSDEIIRPRLGIIDNNFPGGCFPLGAVHEFIYSNNESKAASSGFISYLLSSLMKQGSVCIWINSSETIFPPGLKSFGAEPDKVVFVTVQREKDVLWVLEEALKCEGIAAVVADVKQMSFTVSRRLQLAVEQSRVTGFIICKTKQAVTNTLVSRWRITSLRSALENELPGIGFPRWNIELLKIRNGMPGCWQMELSGNQLNRIPGIVEVPADERLRKVI